MAKITTFNKQFKDGYFPDQHWDESTRLNGPEVSSPSQVRKRQGVALGSQTEANPGMAGKNDYTRSKAKKIKPIKRGK